MRHRKSEKDPSLTQAAREASISASSRTTFRRASGHIVRKSDDVYPILPVLVAAAHQAERDSVAVGLVVDQDATEVVASLRVERLKDRAEVVTRLRTGQGGWIKGHWVPR